MNFSKKHAVPGLIGNAVIVILGLIGIIMAFFEAGNNARELVLYFTFISNVLVVLVSLVGIFLYAASIKNDKNYVSEFYQVLKLISVAMVAITFTMVMVFLRPSNPSFGWFEGSQLFMHAVVPIASIFSFIFLEYNSKIRFRFFFTPIIAVLLYGTFYVSYAFFAKSGNVDWYGFLFEPNNRVAPVNPGGFTPGPFFLFLGESLGGALVFGFVLWLLNKIFNLIFVGYTIEEEDTNTSKVDDILPEEPKKAQNSSKSNARPSQKYKGKARVYHISRSKFISRSWQVKLATGEKAIKIFPTQLEAINYAKDLAKKNGGSIRIHSMKGQLRK